MLPARLKAIITALFDRHSSATVREGGVIADHIVAPASLMGAPLYAVVEDVVKQNTLPRSGSSTALLDAIGERLMASRNTGSHSTSTVRIALDTPRRVVVRAGFPIYTPTGIGYRVVETVTVPESAFATTTKWNQTVYITPPIAVKAVKEGGRSQVTAGSLTVPGFTLPGLVGVYNEADSTTASDRERDIDFEERLRRVISTRSFDTPSGLFFGVSSQMGSDIREVSIIGHGDTGLERARVPARRIVGTDQVSVSIFLDRTSGATVTALSTVNALSATATVSDGYGLTVFDFENGTNVDVPVTTESGLRTELQKMAYGLHGTVFIKAGASLSQDTIDLLDLYFGAVRHPDRTGSTDYLVFGRKGDPTFVAREYLDNPSTGDQTINFSSVSTLETGSVSSVGFANKTRGTSRPNANRLLRRSSLVKLAPVNIYQTEIAQEDYNLLGRPDLRTLRIGTSVLFQDDFSRTDGEGAPVSLTTAIGNGWMAGNTGERKVYQESAAGVYVHEGRLVLGPSAYSAVDVDASLSGAVRSTVGLQAGKSIPAAARGRIQQIRALLQEDVPAPALSDVMYLFEETIKDVAPALDTSEGYAGEQLATSPVVQHPIEDPYGFRLKGTFQTTDDTGAACAITMARTAPGLGEFYRWYEGYGVSVSVSGDDLLPNVFVMDGAASDREMTIVGDELVNGRLDHNALAQARVDIQPGVKYNYEIVFGSPSESDPADSITLEARIWADGGTRPSSPTISYGSYVPKARRTTRLNTTYITGSDVTNDISQNLIANHVGIGVSNTHQNSLWVFDDFVVENVDSDYAQAVTEVDVRGLSGALDMQVVARGVGYNPLSAEKAYGFDVHAWNAALSQWDLMAESTPSVQTYQGLRFLVPIASYESSGRITLLISSRYPHQGEAANAVESVLDLDFVYGEDYRTHLTEGGKADVVFTQSTEESGVDSYRPSTVRTHTIASALPTNVIAPSDIGGPIEEVIRVYSGSGGGAVDLAPSEYRMYREEPSVRNTVRERWILAVDPALVGLALTVEARVHDQVIALQTLLDTSEIRKYDADLLARHRDTIAVDVTAEISNGSWDADRLNTARLAIFEAASVSKNAIANMLH